MESIKEFFVEGWSTLKGILKLEWLNFKNWRAWTALRALYLVFAVLCLVYTCWYGFIYFAACAFFKTEPLLNVLNKLGFDKTKI